MVFRIINLMGGQFVSDLAIRKLVHLISSKLATKVSYGKVFLLFMCKRREDIDKDVDVAKSCRFTIRRNVY